MREGLFWLGVLVVVGSAAFGVPLWAMFAIVLGIWIVYRISEN